MLTRRSFLGFLSAVPVLGRLVPKCEPKGPTFRGVPLQYNETFEPKDHRFVIANPTNGRLYIGNSEWVMTKTGDAVEWHRKEPPHA